MCLACQMEDELWLAYLDQVARQTPPPAAAAANTAEIAPANDLKPASPFACEELPPE